MKAETLLKALRPFAKLIDEWEEDGDTPPIRKGQKYLTLPVKISDLHEARRVYTALISSEK